MATETEKTTPESTEDPAAATRADKRTSRADTAAAEQAGAAARAEKRAGSADAASPRRGLTAARVKGWVDPVRTLIGQVVWIVAVVCALFLAIGALTEVIGAIDGQNDLVQFIRDGAEAVSLGIFSRTDGVFDFVGANSSEYDALSNYGLAAVLYLLVGRILDRVVRP